MTRYQSQKASLSKGAHNDQIDQKTNNINYSQQKIQTKGSASTSDNMPR